MESVVGAAAGALVFVLVAALAALLLLVFKKKDVKGATQGPEPTQAPDARARVQGQRGRVGTARFRPRAGTRPTAQAPTTATYASDSEGGDEDDTEDEEQEASGSRKGRKGKKNKATKKAEREAEREAREAAEEAKREKQQQGSKYDAKRAAKDKAREDKERAQEEEMQRAAAERQAKEDEEAAKWMNLITVETEGTGEAEAQQESQGLLAAFIGYIRERKMVSIEDLAAEFKLRSTEVVDRIQGLESMGRLTGVMDERGKFIFVSPEEMQKVADFIKKRGRISIAELAAKSSQFIDLEMREPAAVTAVPTMDFDSVLNAVEVGA